MQIGSIGRPLRMVFGAGEVMRTEPTMRFNVGSIKNKVHRFAACVKKIDGFKAVETTPASRPSPGDAAGGDEALKQHGVCVQDPDAKRSAEVADWAVLPDPLGLPTPLSVLSRMDLCAVWDRLSARASLINPTIRASPKPRK